MSVSMKALQSVFFFGVFLPLVSQYATLAHMRDSLASFPLQVKLWASIVAVVLVVALNVWLVNM